MNRFQDKVILVTGGRSGIGQAIARELKTEGALVITAQRQPDNEFDYIETDLSDPEACLGLTKIIEKKHGRLDVLVNNAGAMRQSPVHETSITDWNLQLQVNLTAPFLLIKAATSLLRESQGSIVNIGSVEGSASNPQHAAYGASKAGLHGLTRAVAVDLGPLGIRCNAVAPRWIDTDLNEDFINGMPDPETFRLGLSDIHPVARTGKPADVAKLVAFLASTDSAFITGQIYVVDGGRTSKLSLP